MYKNMNKKDEINRKNISIIPNLHTNCHFKT